MPKFMVTGTVTGTFEIIVEADDENAARETLHDAYDDGDVFEGVDGVDFIRVQTREIAKEPDGVFIRLKQFKPGSRTDLDEAIKHFQQTAKAVE